MVWQQVCLVSFTEHSPQFYKPSDIHWYLNSLTCPPVLFIATSHAVTGEHRGWSPSYLDSKMVPRGYSGSLELIKRPGTCYYQITCLNFCCQTLVKSAQRVWRIRNSDYLASTVVVEWFERLLPVPGSTLLCCRPPFVRKRESCTPLTVCFTVQRTGAHRDSLEQFGQQLSLWLLLASLSDPCHNSVTSSQSKFQILFYYLLAKVIVFH